MRAGGTERADIRDAQPQSVMGTHLAHRPGKVPLRHSVFQETRSPAEYAFGKHGSGLPVPTGSFVAVSDEPNEH
jgi:hypothetical protein